MRKRISFWMVAVLMYTANLLGASYYVATNGSDSNSGTSASSPFKTLQKAVSVVSAGDYIYLRGGTHVMTTPSVVITKSGTSSANIRVFAYSGETPVLRFDDTENSSSRGIVMEGDYWHWNGIIIERAGDNGMLLSGNNNTIENCVFRNNHDSGLQLSRYNTDADQISEWPSNNLIVGCEAYDNRDSDNEDADGFAAKLTCGNGNIFRDCVSHHNIDDGWDLYTKSETGPIGIVKFENCIAHNNGILTTGGTSGGGDKNGFKLGSSDNKVDHELRRCIAFNNGKHGFTDNGNIGNIKFYNLTSYNNGDYNYHTRDNASHTFRNCITFEGNHTDRIVGDAPASCNAFDDTDTEWSVVVKSSDFQTLSQGPNSAPTSNGFLNLSSGSSLINIGCSAPGVSGTGTLDLGAIEYGGGTTPPPTNTYTLSTNVSGSGSVSGAGTYNEGTTATVTATAASGWSFSNWTGDASGTSPTATVYMNANKSVTAVFTQGGTTPPPPTGEDVVHNFTLSGLNSSFFNISGNLSDSKGTVVYNGLTLTHCLKMESSTSVTFTTAQEATMTLVFNEGWSGGIKIDGTTRNVSSGILTVTLAAGSHSLTKADVANLYYISLSYNGTTPVTYTLTTTINGSGSVTPSSGTYNAGTSVTMTANPASGWQFDSWSGGYTGNPATVIMDANKNITAYFSEIPVNCEATALTSYIQVNGGSWSQSNSVSVNAGDAVKFGPQPTSGGTWSWSGPNGYSASTREIELTNLQTSQAGTYTATFINDCGASSYLNISLSVQNSTPVNNTITIQENTTGFCGVDGSVDNNNSGFTGSGFANTDNSSGTGIDWAINGNGGSYTFRWNFANGSTTNRTGVLYLNGTAYSTVNFAGTGGWTTWTTTSVTINNVPSGFVEVRLEANQSSGLSNIDYLEVTGSGVSVADCNGGSTNPVTYTLSTSVIGSGSLSGAGTYNEGTVVTLTASPSSDYQVSSWSGVDASNGNTGTVTMNSNRNVSVTFTQIPVSTYTLTTSVNGSGSVSGAGTYTAGTVVTITAYPSSGWKFDSWSGAASGTNTTTTVTVNSNLSVTANFSQTSTLTTITIQENTTGFCGVDGSVDNNNSGFTGSGFANTDNSSGTGVDWAINGNGGSYTFRWNFANGSTTNRTGVLYLNGTAYSTVNFADTGGWTTWTTTSVTINNVPSGFVEVRLEANQSSGLANIDYLEVTGSGISAADCNGGNTNPVTYTVSASVNGSGTVSGAGTYNAGSTATLTATPSSGYQFDNWSGGASGSSNPVTITVNSNISVTANFSQVSTNPVDNSMIGYAAVSGDGYATTTGGQGGSSTTVSSLSALQSWAAGREGNTSPAILYISGKISASSTTVVTVKHGANVSILGLGSTAELQNIGLNIWDYENVIVRNIKIHEVFYPDDALTIDACNHVWVDHMELHSKIGSGIGVDTYDGLLDIKRGSKYVTISWCHLHDHMKTMLIGHTDNTSSQSVDGAMRITLHHNYYQNTDGRNPSVRFGAVHMFNNYFNNISDYGLAARVGAHVLVENCHYNNVELSMSTDKFPVSGLPNGYICQSGNMFTGNTGAPVISQSDCGWWNLPYAYTLDPVSTVASNVPANVGVGKINELKKTVEGVSFANNIEVEQNYPNPFSDHTNFSFTLSTGMYVKIILYNAMGQFVGIVADGKFPSGKTTIEYVNQGLPSGIYLYTVETLNGKQVMQMLVK
ncbi:MAG: carbohydrate-binding protein [Bacteroidales bacterium]|nr:carbohydrate-binding protein [Bacteroidales bacterium]